MDLKKFFKKKQVDLKFKKAGPGQRLNEETKKTAPTSKEREPSVSRVEPSPEAKQAAAAALARLQGTPQPASFSKPSLYTAMKSEVKQELKSARKNSSDNGANEPVKTVVKTIDLDSNHFAADGVYFKCPLIGEEILSKNEWKTKIRDYLYSQLESEKGLIACLIIRNCNKNPEKINACIETLRKYLRNIINNPDEEKYRKIRLSNKVFQEKVAGMEGTFEFLEAAGFSKQQLTVQDKPEEFFVMSEDKAKDTESLEMLADALNNAETINLELDRNVQILLPSQAERRTQLPDDFFRYTPEELKKEQQSRTETVESMLVLRTKAMREKQELKEMKKYRYALIRVRFPDGILLQGTFSVYEKYEEVHKFVKENLAVDCEFSLVIAEIGKTFTQEDFDKTLMDLHLVPATVLLFHSSSWSSESKYGSTLSFLKPDISVLLQNL